MNREERLDVIVVGGGIIGLASATCLAKNGFKVTLLERKGVHQETSANSHRIIHGGLRYMQSLDFTRLARSLSAKNSCLQEYPDQIKPLDCLLTIPEKGLKRSFILGLAGAVYGASAPLLGHPPEWTSLVPVDEVKGISSRFKNISQRKAFKWTDARLVNPEALAQSLVKELNEAHGQVRENSPVASIENDSDGYLVTTESGENLSARMVVLATGPWHGSIQTPTQFEFKPFGWAKAFNLVLSENIVTSEAVGITSPSGQVLFFAPREGEGCALGTWYTPYTGDPGKIDVSDSEIKKALAEVNSALDSSRPLSISDVESIESGVLPMQGLKNGEPQLYGSEHVECSQGLISILSTKYTVFPVLSQQVLALVQEYLREN